MSSVDFSPQALEQLIAEVTAEVLAEKQAAWPATIFEYFNTQTGRYYEPHNDEELQWVLSDEKRYPAAFGGEGSGKSVAGIIKDLERLKRGHRGAMVSPDLPHFKKSLWAEFRAWCPKNVVVPKQRYRLEESWEPQQMFTLAFLSMSGTASGVLLCGGIDKPSAWEGPNLHFAHMDEARRRDDPLALKTLDGRVRLSGRDGARPQLWVTTTPRKHWLFDMYGPLIVDANGESDDEFEDFKRDTNVIRLRTQDNEKNTVAGFAAKRGQSLTEQEKRILLDGEWEDPVDSARFLESMILWDNCFEPGLPPPSKHKPQIMALDAGVSSDSFGLVTVSRHPADKARVAVQHHKVWYPPKKGTIDYGEIEEYIVQYCKDFSVVEICYDPYQLHYMQERLTKRRAAYCFDFSQGDMRLEADKMLFDSILSRTVSHNNEPDLRTHIDNANRKLGPDDKRLRLVKRAKHLKIDLAVCLSMAVYRCLSLNL